MRYSERLILYNLWHSLKGDKEILQAAILIEFLQEYADCFPSLKAFTLRFIVLTTFWFCFLLSVWSLAPSPVREHDWQHKAFRMYCQRIWRSKLFIFGYRTFENYLSGSIWSVLSLACVGMDDSLILLREVKRCWIWSRTRRDINLAYIIRYLWIFYDPFTPRVTS